MQFDRLLNHSSVNTKKHTVGLAIYFLDEIEDETPIGRKDISEIFDQSRIDISDRHISAYISQLRDDGYIMQNDGGYLLTASGIENYGELFDLPEQPNETRTDDFVDVNYPNNEFYEELLDSINKSYKLKIYDGTLILTRKLFESLLIDILRGHYGNSEIPLYFNPDTAQYRSFSKLISNFEDRLQDFQHYSQSLDDDFIEKLEDFRHDGNESAHSIEVNIPECEIEEKSNEATRIARILFNVWTTIQVAEGIDISD